MSTWTLPWVTFGAAVGSCAIGGVFFGFSSFIMKALSRVPAEDGIRAMQSINVSVINPWFLAPFVGTVIVCLLLGVGAATSLPQSGSVLRLVGCALYAIGTFGITMAFNVPLNDALAKLAPNTAEAGVFWGHYLAVWTAWNHVRTAAALIAAALLGASLLVGRSP